MSKTKNNGGAAFPRPAGQTTQWFRRPQDGMTLRDYFAAKAMQGLMTVYWDISDKFATGDELVSSQVETAYEYADAMLKEREK